MKKLYTLIAALFTFFFMHAQNPVPNGGFQTYWSNGRVADWTDTRDIMQVAPGNQSTSAAQGYKTATTYPAYITSSGGVGFAISTAYTYLNLYYKFTPVSGDVMYVGVTIFDASHNSIGFGNTPVAAAGNYTALSVPIYYSGSGPATAVISVVMNTNQGGVPHVGSNFIIDNVSLAVGALAVEDIEKENALFSVYPNPATNQLFTQTGGIKVEQVNIYNAAGSLEMTVSSPADNGSLSIGNLSNGVYIAEIKTEQAIVRKRFVKM